MQNKVEHKGELIEFDLYKKILNRIIEHRILSDRSLIPIQIVYHGGEVLLLGEKRLYEMLEYTAATFRQHKVNYSLACQTNATLLTDTIAKIFSKFEVSIGLSFDGIEGSNSSRTSLKQEVFESKFEMLKANKTRFGFLIVASKANVANMQKTQEYLETLGLEEHATEGIIKGYKINYAEDMINPGENSEIELTGHEMFEKVWKPELKRFLKRGKTLEHHTNDLIVKTLVDILSYHTIHAKSGCGTKWCGAGVTMIAIEPDGEMDYCDRYAKKYPEAYVQHALDYDFCGIHQLKKAIEYNVMKDRMYKQYGCDTCYADYICDHGCEAFYKSKYGEYGIDTRLVCDQHKEVYSYILNHLEEFLDVYMRNTLPIKTSDDILGLKETFVEKLKHQNILITFETGSLYDSIIVKEKIDGSK